METVKKAILRLWKLKWSVLTVIFMLGVPVLSYLMMESFKDSYKDLNSTLILFFNLAFVYLFEAFLFFLTLSPRAACTGTAALCLIIGAAEYAVLSFRSVPIQPWDLLSIGTALSVAGNYKFVFTKKVIWLLVGYFLLILSSLVLCRAKPMRKNRRSTRWIVRAVGVLLCIPLAFGYICAAQNEKFQDDARYYPYLFTPTVVYRRNGFFFSFASLLKYMDISVPYGYDVQELENAAEKYESGAAGEKDGKPNIIVIMNESFSDISVLGDFEYEGDYMPFVSSLTENTVKGQAYVSVKGGNTPNSEYEFLTGDTMAFLPSGSIPYQQYIKAETENFMSGLKDMGYTTYAIHPYNASGWKRDTVYPLLGIDESFFLSSFPKVKLVRNYVSDEAVYDRVIRIYNDSLGKEEQVAIFCVTMQNHGGYSSTQTYDNFGHTVKASGMRNSYLVSTYLSLVQVSDTAFEGLVDYFSGIDEPTVIVMFGDHEPNSSVTKPILDINGIDEETDDWNVRKNQYVVPFVIWANYDIEEQSDVVTSLNYLNILVSEAAGLPLSPYQNFRKELMEEYPVITANFCIDKGGVLHTRKEMDADDGLLFYRQLQYNHLFDTNKTIENFFD